MKIPILSIVILMCCLTSSYSGVPLSRYEQLKFKAALESQVTGLYDANDKVITVSYLNLKSHVYGQKFANLMQFYNSFCGHCRNFAPKYKKLAKDVWPWRQVLKVMAIDCADEENNGICRDYEVMAYPTLRYFSPGNREGKSNLGTDIKTQNVTTIKEILIGFLMNETSTESSWPNFSTVITASDIDENLERPEIQYLFLISETEGSTLVEHLILDFHRIEGIQIRRVSSNMANVLLMGSDAMIAIDKNRNKITFQNINATYEAYKDEISKFIESKNLREKEMPTERPIDSDAHLVTDIQRDVLVKVKSNIPTIYQADLEKALRFSMFIEIPKIATLSGERLLALQRYVGTLRKYNPLGENGQQFLQKVEEYIFTHNQNIRGEDIENKLKQLEETYSPIFSSDRWVGCLPSKPRLRGYTCGLWQLFHFMTVQAAETDRSTNPLEVLQAIHGYVRYFFGCSNCADHFLQMADRRKIWSVPSKDEAALWLWAAHNEVNKRLAGDPTEDPEFPKIQFPAKNMCADCYREPSNVAIALNEINWDKNEVLAFLKRIYTQQNVSRYGVENESVLPKQEAIQQKRIMGNVFSDMDMRMGILLYVFCIGMMIAAVKLFLYKGYRKKIYTHDFLGKV